MGIPDLSSLAAEIVNSYMSEEVPPTEHLLKVAQREGLSKEWVRRLAETTNVALHKKIQEQVGSSMIEFKLADAQAVISDLAGGISKMSGIFSMASAASDLERGMSKSAADEWIHNLDKRLEKDPKMQKYAGINKEKAISERRRLEIKKAAEMFRSNISGNLQLIERQIEHGIMKVSAQIVKESPNDNPGVLIGEFRKVALNTFAGREEFINKLIDFIKGEPFFAKHAELVSNTAATMNLEGSVGIQVSDIIENCEIAHELGKVAEMIEKENLVRLVSSEAEGVAVIEKIAVTVNNLLRMAWKHKGKVGMGALGITFGVPEIIKKLKTDLAGTSSSLTPRWRTGETQIDNA